MDDRPDRVASLARLLDALDDGAVALDDDGTVVAVNDAALSALAPDRDRQAVRGEPAGALLSGVDRPAPGETVDVDGAEGRRTYEARVSAADGLAAEVDRLVVVRDVTTRVREVRRLRALARVLRHAMRDEMTGVLGRAEYVRDAIEEASVLSEARRAADAVVDATRDLADLGETAWAVEEVFTDGGPENEPRDVVPVVETVVSSLHDDYSEVKLETDLPDAAQGVAAGSLEAAIEGVVADACERNDAPVPRVDVSVSVDDDAVAIAVADNGSGIDDEARRILETGEGPALRTGGDLDLWLAHWVVDAAGGDVTVGENVPRGTVVTLELPAAE
jgi:signal transduction histidine kinase